MKPDQWLALGIFLMGTGIGALLTRIALSAYTAQTARRRRIALNPNR